MVPDSVIWSFYIGAAILILCVIYTTMKVKEWNPQQYAEYNEAKREEGRMKNSNAEASEDKAGWITLLRKAPSTFWKVGLVQFFCWAGFLYLWNYSTGAIAETVWNTTDPASEAFFAPQGAIYLLEGGTGSVLLLGWFPLSLELFYGSHR